jgi:hypothetical protein
MAGDERLWVITLGAPQPQGRSRLHSLDLYYAVDSDGEKCIPASTPLATRLDRYSPW